MGHGSTISNKVKIVIADNNKTDRNNIQTLIKKEKTLRLLSEMGRSTTLTLYCRKFKPDLIITRIKLKDKNLCVVAKSLQNEFPDIQMIAISGHRSETDLVALIRAGVKGFVWKGAIEYELIPAIQRVIKNQSYYCARTSDMLSQIITSNKFSCDKRSLAKHTKSVSTGRDVELSSKEIEIIQLICKGCTNQEISKIVGRSKRSVEGIREEIIQKTGVKNTAAIIVYAIKNNLFTVR